MNSRIPLAKQGEGVATPPIRPDAVRSVIQVVDGEKTSDGAGVLLTRVIGTGALPQLDPFLLLDAFHSDDPSAYIAGFPDHPHRGFETVTYMVAGRLRHRDNKGHSGVVGPGGVQWMTAGRGIVHSEMPEQVDGLMAGFQLWINLPAKHKMTEPRYRDIAPKNRLVSDRPPLNVTACVFCVSCSSPRSSRVLFRPWSTVARRSTFGPSRQQTRRGVSVPAPSCRTFV